MADPVNADDLWKTHNDATTTAVEFLLGLLNDEGCETIYKIRATVALPELLKELRMRIENIQKYAELHRQIDELNEWARNRGMTKG